MLITEKDKKVCDLKLQKDIINQIIKEIEIKRYTFKMMMKLRNILLKFMEKFKLFLTYNI